MPLALGDAFNQYAKVIEIYIPEVNGEYMLERYEILDIYSGMHRAFIFYINKIEYTRDTRHVFLNDLIEFHFKHKIMNLFPLIKVQ